MKLFYKSFPNSISKSFGVISIVACSLLANAQQINFDGTFKYFVGVQQPQSDWNLKQFTDSLWANGHTSIGYGDNDDTVTIDTAVSVYLRYPFEAQNIQFLNDLCLMTDFDDAFVAYLNGNEIARVNLGKQMSSTVFDQLSDRSHEAYNYRQHNGSVQGYYIDKSKALESLVEGDNILAVEVHNDSINGSDLSFWCQLLNVDYYYNMYDPNSRYKRPVTLDSTALPIVMIETGEYGIPVKDIRVPATLSIIDGGKGSYNKPDLGKVVFASPISIEVRGQSSSDFPKQSYNFELQDALGNDTSLSLLGLPAESDWVLFGPFADKSQLRNALIYEMARKTGHWAPHTVYCEVVLNGEFVGLYNLVEKIKRDKNRVDIAKLDETDISASELTGGYIVKYDKGSSGIQLVYPKDEDILPEQKSYITNYFNDYNALIKSSGIFDPQTGVQNRIDYRSLVDFVMISEFGKNCDSYLFSTYMHKDRDDKDGRLKFGPIWDFDLCFGNAIWQDGYKTNGWQFEYPDNNRLNLKRLFMDTNLVNLFQYRWIEARATYLHTDSVNATIDKMVNELAPAIERNYQVWPVLTHDLFWPAYSINNYNDEIAHIKSWIDTRTKWIDVNLPKLYYKNPYATSVESLAMNESALVEAYPNPFSDQLAIEITTMEPTTVSVRLIAVNGQQQVLVSHKAIGAGKSEMTLPADAIKQGLYILEVSIGQTEIHHLKLLKAND